MDRRYGIHVLAIALICANLISGCVSDSDKDWWTPNIHADLNWLNLTALNDTITNFNDTYDMNLSIDDATNYSLTVIFPDNTTYLLNNITYNISASFLSFHSNGHPNYWMDLQLLGSIYSQYRYSSIEDAKEATYLLEPSWELTKYFLNESSNPMPEGLRYGVE